MAKVEVWSAFPGRFAPGTRSGWWFQLEICYQCGVILPYCLDVALFVCIVWTVLSCTLLTIGFAVALSLHKRILFAALLALKGGSSWRYTVYGRSLRSLEPYSIEKDRQPSSSMKPTGQWVQTRKQKSEGGDFQQGGQRQEK